MQKQKPFSQDVSYNFSKCFFLMMSLIKKIALFYFYLFLKFSATPGDFLLEKPLIYERDWNTYLINLNILWE